MTATDYPLCLFASQLSVLLHVHTAVNALASLSNVLHFTVIHTFFTAFPGLSLAAVCGAILKHFQLTFVDFLAVFVLVALMPLSVCVVL